MERDKRVGSDQWKGCYTFADIICDGSSARPSSRSGGLKMGGTYWYYVRSLTFHSQLNCS